MDLSHPSCQVISRDNLSSVAFSVEVSVRFREEANEGG
jgi:hypothetical protein